MEWLVMSELLPERFRTGRPSKWHLAQSSMRLSRCLRPAANGALCRRIFRRSRPFSIAFAIGATVTWLKINRVLVGRASRHDGEASARVIPKA
jgi:hypothetical protein